MTATHTIEDPRSAADKGFNTKLPTTRLGRVSMWMAAAFVVAFIINNAFVGIFGMSTNPAMRNFSETYMPYWGFALMATGFVAGIVGLVAILKQKERSLLTLLTFVPTLMVITFLLGEFLIPH